MGGFKNIKYAMINSKNELMSGNAYKLYLTLKGARRQEKLHNENSSWVRWEGKSRIVKLTFEELEDE